MPWLSAFLSLALYTLTVLYCSDTETLSRIQPVGASPSHSILTLRVLSELASLSLAATIAMVFDELQCVLVFQRGSVDTSHGISLASYLGLDPGTGVMGLLGMVFGRRVPNLTARVWSSIRLGAIIMIPILNILIMGESISSMFLVFPTFSLVRKRTDLHDPGPCTANTSCNFRGPPQRLEGVPQERTRQC